MRIQTRDLTPELWPEMEKLFGLNGACAGCWCMWWRLAASERISVANGPRMKHRQRELVKAGFRRQGLSRALLRHALRSIRAAGGRIAEAYPVRPPATNAAAFTGTVPFLESEGFVTLTAHPRGRQRARRVLR